MAPCDYPNISAEKAKSIASSVEIVKEKYMKETHIISKYQDLEIIAQIVDGKIAMITEDNEAKNEGSWMSDNDEYIFAIYKVLKEVDKKGGFNHLKKEGEEDIEKIYV